ncbi:5-hydroxytryptamine receptor 1A-alpha-like [Limulus polyphemus]|uniref:5-hydroxytryptamine receptor 1A-alpha-like n=1 Tax=Limulus polyphemus TaxID=6850 RepID=A0ABM1SSB2_LIMPO|nr:5-hydroxytryptamine receptor 1A-alpha-like [Limulus polyphemus]
MEISNTSLTNKEGTKDFTVSAVAVGFTLVITCISLLGNSAVIAITRMDNELRLQVSNLLIVNLAVTDLLTSLLVMIPSVTALFYERWILGDALCKLHCSFNYCFIIVSMLSLSLITIDRGVAMKNPLRYVQTMTNCRIGLMISYVWIHGLVFAIVPSLNDWVHFDYSEAVCTIKWEVDVGIITYVTAAFMCCFILPAGIIVFYNFSILRSALKLKHNVIQPKLLQSETSTIERMLGTRKISSSQGRRHSTGFINQKIVKSILVIILVFFVCMTPFCLTKLLKVLVGVHVVPPWLSLFSTAIQFTASATNPFIYAVFRRDFRDAFKRLIRRLFVF